MDFFEQQEQARKKTKFLLVYYVLAILGITAAVYLVTILAWNLAGAGLSGQTRGAKPETVIWDPQLFLGASVGTLAVILLGSGFKSMQLLGGGSVVAKELGGNRVDPQTTDPYERRLLNVVEEMAIASGTPVPGVYLMEHELGINAFAAGKSTSDAVVGVTRGCMEMLSRDELQGVIAHEFSHILNGDMKLNMRLMGLLFGILSISIIGRVITRMLWQSQYYGGHHRRRNDDNGGGLQIAFWVLGLGLAAIGSVGVFFGRLIQSAVSRQREFLADASAVQFTRNPDGISGALKKIGGLQYGSTIGDAHVEEASHMFFASGLKAKLTSSFASHPPLPMRIKEIQPSWDGRFPKVTQAASVKEDTSYRKPKKENAIGAMGFSPAEIIQNVGSLTPEQVNNGHDIHGEFSDELLEKLHDLNGAQALIYSFLMTQDDKTTSSEIDVILAEVEPHIREQISYYFTRVQDLHSSRKIALVDIAIPALRRMAPQEYDDFVDNITKLIHSDQHLDLFEFSLQKIVKRHLGLYFHIAPAPTIKHRKLEPLTSDAVLLLSALAHVGQENSGDEDGAFRSAIADLGVHGELMPKEACTYEQLDNALNRFDRSSPLVKKRLLHACSTCVMHDGIIESEEAELLRAIADTIGCPMPPLLKKVA